MAGVAFAVDPSAVPRLMTRLIVADDSPESSDMIYVLNGKIGPRVARAVQLHQQGLAPRIFVPQTREMARRPDRPLSDLVAAGIVAGGVPDSAVGIVAFEGGVVDTRDEGRALRQYVEKNPVRRVLVVTMDYHTGRASRTLRQELRGFDVELIVIGASDPRLITPENWWMSEEGRRTYVSEFVKHAATIVQGLVPII